MKLYKYSRYSQHLLGILAKNTVWLSAAEQFNDIFDCKFQKTRLSNDQHKELKAIHKHREGCDDRIPVDIIDQELTSKNTKSLIDAEYRNIDLFISKFGIMSLSEVPDSLLLWAHYGDNHSGVCLEYETLGDMDPCLLPVNYSTQYPSLSIYEFGIDIVKATESILSTKSMEWAYEKEWRYAIPGGANTEIANPFKLTAVVFGARVKPDHINTIKAILNSSKIEYRQAKQSDKRFSIEIESITSDKNLPTTRNAGSKARKIIGKPKARIDT